MKKVGQKSSRGGIRAGAGRPEGQTKRKISISVDAEVLDLALNRWDGKPSHLIEKLLRDYVK